ncbi:MAG: hypothetical protein ABUK11_07385 [Mariprofundaceae bacterium]
MVRTLLILIAVYIGYRLYKRTFLEKSCLACGKQIKKEAPICHHCNTVQTEGIVIDSESLKSDVKPPAGLMKRLQLPVAILLLAVIAAAAGAYFLGLV